MEVDRGSNCGVGGYDEISAKGTIVHVEGTIARLDGTIALRDGYNDPSRWCVLHDIYEKHMEL
jgi:hypothetical protein